MQFHSILFDRPETGIDESDDNPIFTDLNLDRLFDSILINKKEYRLRPFFYLPLRDVAAVNYRHEILRDIKKESVSAPIETFAKKMRSMREHLARVKKLNYKYHKESWFLDAVEMYCDAVGSLAEEFVASDIRSRGLLAFRDYLTGYIKSDEFVALVAETRKLKDDLAGVKYCIHIKGNRVRVSRYEEEDDYSADVEKTFARFEQGAVEDYHFGFSDRWHMNHVEARVLDLVARLHPDIFSALDDYCDLHNDYFDEAIVAFDREVQFYVAYLEFIARFKSMGLNFCYPHILAHSKEIRAREAFDLALADKLLSEKSNVVCNDFYLKNPERIFVVTGPNQGGKTTFARMFGQLHYLAALGFPVPARSARLLLPDEIFTHFEKEEDIQTLRGKLEDELTRIHDILRQATGDSIIIMNESFNSTTLRDTIFIGTKVIKRIIELDSLCVYVTFVDELASLGESTAGMVGTVLPDDPTLRTYKLVRKQADGLAYATAIAEKYGLSYEPLRRRMAS